MDGCSNVNGGPNYVRVQPSDAVPGLGPWSHTVAQFELARRASLDECQSWDTWRPPTQAGSTRPPAIYRYTPVVPGGTTPNATSSLDE